MAQIGTDIKAAKAWLDKGDLVAIPTETVYGLAGSALDAAAVARIFEVKQRPHFDPLIVHTHAIETFGRFADEPSDDLLRLAERFTPGPITFVLPKKPIIPDLVTAGMPSVALRIPDHPLTLDLLQRLNYPLAAPSANPFGFSSPTRASHVADQLGDAIPYILDGGPCRVGVESTIVRDQHGTLEVLRLGGLTLEELEDTLSKRIPVRTSSSRPQAPGMLTSHYNPGVPVLLGDIPALLETHAQKALGILSFQTRYAHPNIVHQEVLSASGDTREAARNLFQALRAFHDPAIELILSETVPDQGLGRAINDRLQRAAK
ncbi:MAG: threonylcarbamoyl-AMP synthase [Leptolyngbya sp. SIO3F4]|nr:threonylcarbamoyl-AMP synthase [Leptolyngbya sp. SIO3F4]